MIATDTGAGELDVKGLSLGSVEAIVLSLDRPVPSVRIAEGLAAAGVPGATAEAVEAAIAELNEQYAASGRAFRIEQVAGGFRLMTLPEHATVIAAFRQARAATRLTRAAIETLGSSRTSNRSRGRGWRRSAVWRAARS